LFPSIFASLLSVLVAIKVFKSNSLPNLSLILLAYSYLFAAGLNSISNDHCNIKMIFPINYTVITWLLIILSIVIIYRSQFHRLAMSNKVIIVVSALISSFDFYYTNIGLLLVTGNLDYLY